MAKPNEIAGKQDALGVPKKAPTELPTLTGATSEASGDSLKIKLEGTGFEPNSIVSFNGLDVPTTVKSETELEFTVKPPGVGSYPIQVKVGETATPVVHLQVTGLEIKPPGDQTSPLGHAKSAPAKAEKENPKAESHAHSR